jgi:broad specificity phosphatase PhoE
MSTIYMIRHGQASFSSSDYDRLSELGRMQSEILGEYMFRIGISFDAVYSGALLRQTNTAEIVLDRMADPARDNQAHTAMQIDPKLNEYEAHSIMQSQLPGLLEEKPFLAQDLEHLDERRSFQRVFEGTILRWISGRHDREGIETWKAFTSRIGEAIKNIMAENGRGKTVAVFTSGGPICAAVQMAIGVTDETAVRLNWQLRNTSVSVFKYDNEGPFLNSFNSMHHLQDRRNPKLLTYR